MADTLILNANMLPIGIVPISSITWQESIKLTFLDRVEIIEEYKDWIVSSTSISMFVPSVIMLKDYVNVETGVKFTRNNILLRDDYTCQYCGAHYYDDQKKLTMDHVVPRYNKGQSTWENLVTACSPCNIEKAHYTKMKPKNMPKKPSYYQLAKKRTNYNVMVPDESWVNYLNWSDKSKVIVMGKKLENNDDNLLTFDCQEIYDELSKKAS